MQLTIALGILVVTIGLAISHIKIGKITIDHAVAAMIGAILMVAFRIVSGSIWSVAAEFLYIPIMTITSLMTITFVAEYSGLFNSIVQYLVTKANGNGKKLYAYLFFFGSFLGMFFSNDAVVLLFTPLVIGLVENIKQVHWKLENKIPFYFAVLSMANLVGGLTISNPINVVVASRFDISFIEYAKWMILPAITCIFTTFIILYFTFKNTIPKKYIIPEVQPVSFEQKLFQIFVGITFGIVALCIMFLNKSYSHFSLPIGAIISIVLYKTFSVEKISFLLKEISWDLLVFMYGMFIVAMGLREAGLAQVFRNLFSVVSQSHFSFLSTMIGYVSAFSSAMINNHATVDFLTWVLKELNMNIHEIKMLAYSVIIGGDVGPKIFPLGSLAAIMWFGMLKKRGVNISFYKYISLGIPVSLVSIFFSLAMLNLEYVLFSMGR